MDGKISKVIELIKKWKYEIMFVLGVAMAGWGGFCRIVFPYALKFGLEWNFKLDEGKFIMDFWKETPVTLMSKVYLFNIQNAEQFLEGAVPDVKEVGPFVFKVQRIRKIMEWSGDERKVKFTESYNFNLMDSKSEGSMSDKVTMVNVPLLVVFTIISKAMERIPMTSKISSTVANVVNSLMTAHEEKLIETRTVEEVLVGRRYPMFDTIDRVLQPLRTLGLSIPEYGSSAYKLRDNKYGFLAMRTGRTFGPFEVFTGMAGTDDKFSMFATYNGKKYLGYYDHKQCDSINGSDGSFFGIFPEVTEPVYVFHSHACRSFRFDYVDDTTVTGVATYRYEMAKDSFDSSRSAKCFCPKGIDPSKCDGMLDLGRCMPGLPFALTFPHFLNTDRFSSYVNGLSPNTKSHLSFFEVEKTIGATVRGLLRLQLNLKLRPLPFVPGLGNLKGALLPHVWVEEVTNGLYDINMTKIIQGGILEGNVGLIVKAGSWAINLSYRFFVLSMVSGILIVVVSSGLMMSNKKNKTESSTKVSQWSAAKPGIGETRPGYPVKNGFMPPVDDDDDGIVQQTYFIQRKPAPKPFL